MLRQERLKYCKTCQKREFDFNKGILCSITKDYADFEDSCLDYLIDEKIQILEAYKSEQDQIKKRKQKKVIRSKRRKRPPEKLQLNDLFLLIGSGLITLFFIRILYYMNFSYSGDSGSYFIFLIIYLSSVITLLLRKKEEWKFRVFGDIKFKALYSLVLAFTNLLYVVLFDPGSPQIGITFLAFMVASFVLSMFSVIMVIPINLLFQITLRSNDPAQ